jgi:hypothetical protein
MDLKIIRYRYKLVFALLINHQTEFSLREKLYPIQILVSLGHVFCTGMYANVTECTAAY